MQSHERDALDDKITRLILEVIERDTSATAGAAMLIGLVGIMAAGLGTSDRYRLAARARDLADQLERRELVRS